MYMEKILKLMEMTKNQEEREYLTKNINQCFQYTNIAMEAIYSMMDKQDMAVLEHNNAVRNTAHNRMCEALENIDRMAERKGIGKIYEMNLQREYDRNGRDIGYSMLAHMRSAEMAAITIEEITFMGRCIERDKKALERLEQDQIERAGRRKYEPLNFETLMEKAQEFSKKHFAIDEAIRDNPDKEIVIELVKYKEPISVLPNDEYSIDIDCSCSSYMQERLNIYLDNDNMAYDVPKSELREIIEDTNGFNLEGIYEIEREQEINGIDETIQKYTEKVLAESKEKEEAIEKDILER